MTVLRPSPDFQLQGKVGRGVRYSQEHVTPRFAMPATVRSVRALQGESRTTEIQKNHCIPSWCWLRAAKIIWYKQLLHLHFGKVSCFRSSPSRLRDLIQEPSFSVDNRWTPLPSIREVLYLEASGTLHYALHMRVGIDDHRRAFTSEDFSLERRLASLVNHPLPLPQENRCE